MKISRRKHVNMIAALQPLVANMRITARNKLVLSVFRNDDKE